jgi:hypothetical protein
MSPSFRYWDYPEPGPAALAMLASSPLRDQLQALLEEGECEAIEEWLARAEVPQAVKEILRQGYRGQDTFDVVEVGQLSWQDHLSTMTICLVTRRGAKLTYQAWQDGVLIGEHETDSELRGEEMRNLMVKGDIDDDDYEGKTAFAAYSDFHDDLEDYEGWTEESDVEELLEKGVIEGRQLPGHDFAGRDLTGLRASRANLDGASFYGARLVGADFYAASLRHADFRFTDLRDACFQDADLEGARFHEADPDDSVGKQPSKPSSR